MEEMGVMDQPLPLPFLDLWGMGDATTSDPLGELLSQTSARACFASSQEASVGAPLAGSEVYGGLLPVSLIRIGGGGAAAAPLPPGL